MFCKILLATDGSDHALAAAKVAGELAVKLDAELTMVAVFQPMTVPAFDASGLAPSYQIIEEVQTAVMRRTAEMIKPITSRFDFRQEIGYPAEVILDVAREGDYDLIVLGSRGQSAIKSFLLGSVSDRVMHHAHCAVLIVKEPYSKEPHHP